MNSKDLFLRIFLQRFWHFSFAFKLLIYFHKFLLFSFAFKQFIQFVDLFSRIWTISSFLHSLIFVQKLQIKLSNLIVTHDWIFITSCFIHTSISSVILSQSTACSPYHHLQAQHADPTFSVRSVWETAQNYLGQLFIYLPVWHSCSHTCNIGIMSFNSAFSGCEQPADQLCSWLPFTAWCAIECNINSHIMSHWL